ncbi:hypothetical protein [Microbaculum marinum]|uniref:Uncharacterized protein n=1 Tax=Microbaculum marinum TaxID=1764581 RepID=A0AAW9RGZ6_9HYPH
MIASTRTGRAAALALALAAAISAPGAADAAGTNVPEVAQPRVLVPHVPAPHVPQPAPRDRISGCWSGERLIYGPYAFSFCSNGDYGSYQVRGGGLACNGSVTVSRGPGDTVTVNLSRSQCNNWTDWSADRLVCRTGDRVWIDQPYASRPEVAQPHVAVPRRPAPMRQLDCTYFPAAAGYHPIGLALSRN